MKINGQFLKIIFGLSLILFFVSNYNLVFGVGPDSDDVFEIITPRPDSTISGEINVRLQAFDDDSEDLSFEAKLFDTSTCREQDFGSITEEIRIPSSQNQNFDISWDTSQTQQTSELEDGEYCLRICINYLNGENPYLACKARNINIRNNNSSPEILSEPSTLTFTEGEVFEYQIEAKDPDGDELDFSFLITNDLFSISEDGRIISDPLVTFGQDSILLPIKIRVSDGKTDLAIQEFTIRVNSRANNFEENNSQPDPNIEDDDENVVISVSQINIDEFEFINPNENSVFTGNGMFIEWEGLEIESEIDLSIEYKAESEANWVTISNSISSTQSYYLWDFSNLGDDEYRLRISIPTSDSNGVRLLSDIFEIDRNLEDTETEIDEVPQINNLTPSNNEELDSGGGVVLSGDLVPTDGAEIQLSTIEIKLDGRIITPNCEITTFDFTCKIENELASGRHLASVSVEDTNENSNQVEWVFSVSESLDSINNPSVDEENIEETSEDTIVILGREVPRTAGIVIGFVFIVGGILLFIPWILYNFWLGGRDKEIKQVSYINPPDENLPETNETTIYQQSSITEPDLPDPYYQNQSTSQDSIQPVSQIASPTEPVNIQPEPIPAYEAPQIDTSNFVVPDFNLPSINNDVQTQETQNNQVAKETKPTKKRFRKRKVKKVKKKSNIEENSSSTEFVEPQKTS